MLGALHSLKEDGVVIVSAEGHLRAAIEQDAMALRAIASVKPWGSPWRSRIGAGILTLFVALGASQLDPEVKTRPEIVVIIGACLAGVLAAAYLLSSADRATEYRRVSGAERGASPASGAEADQQLAQTSGRG